MGLLEQFAVVAQRLRRAPRVYQSWVKQFVTFSAAVHGVWKHPVELGTADVEAFLNDLVVRQRLSASAQNQALWLKKGVKAYSRRHTVTAGAYLTI